MVDLRSDTVTKPTSEMRQAMVVAEVGDDVFGEDPTVKKLEARAAEMLNKEDALFVSSGTMGNLIAIMNHCDVRGCEAYCGEDYHCLLHEQTGAAQLAGVNLRPLKTNPDGTFDLKELESKLRRDRDHEPISKLVIVENTLNGKIIPLPWLKEVASFCKRHELKLHMDGARVWNASIGSNVDIKEIVEGFDSVTFCLSKGLGAPVGSLLCGTKEFTQKSRRLRKLLGGGTRQAGILAAAGLMALNHIPNLSEDHRKASCLASALDNFSKFFQVDLASVQTNMVFLGINSPKPELISANVFAQRLREGQGAIVKCFALNENLVRFVLHRDVKEEEFQLAVEKIKSVIKSLEGALGSSEI